MLIDKLRLGADIFACLWILKILNKESSYKSLLEVLDDLVSVLELKHIDTRLGSAVLHSDDNVLRNIDKTSCQITGVSGSQSRISQTLTGTTGCDKVFQNVKTLTVVSSDRHLDGST